jgi:hypothetical protein
VDYLYYIFSIDCLDYLFIPFYLFYPDNLDYLDKVFCFPARLLNPGQGLPAPRAAGYLSCPEKASPDEQP